MQTDPINGVSPCFLLKYLTIEEELTIVTHYRLVKIRDGFYARRTIGVTRKHEDNYVHPIQSDMELFRPSAKQDF